MNKLWSLSCIILLLLTWRVAVAQTELENELGYGDEEQSSPEPSYASAITLQGLNKITARISTLRVTKGSAITFGNLEIIAKQCIKSAPEDKPENKVLLEILEQKPGEDKRRIFYGWMFSSSPALSALEHPVYDITVMNCEKTIPKSGK